MTEPDFQQQETSLVHRASHGDGDAFEELVAMNYGKVYLTALSYLKDHETSHDLAQEVFLRAWLNISTIQSSDRFPQWLGRITRNLSITWLRQGKSKSALVAMLPLEMAAESIPIQSDHSPRGRAELREMSGQLCKAVMELPHDERLAVLLHYADQKPVSQIAQFTGEHTSTIMRRLDRARHHLRKYWDEGEATGMAGLGNEPAFKVHPGRIASISALVLAVTNLPDHARAALVQSAKTTAPLPVPLSDPPAIIASRFLSSKFSLWILAIAFALAALGFYGITARPFQRPDYKASTLSPDWGITFNPRPWKLTNWWNPESYKISNHPASAISEQSSQKLEAIGNRDALLKLERLLAPPPPQPAGNDRNGIYRRNAASTPAFSPGILQTSSSIFVSGKVKYDDGLPVTSGAVTVSWSSSPPGVREVPSSGTARLTTEGFYVLNFPAAKRAWFRAETFGALPATKFIDLEADPGERYGPDTSYTVNLAAGRSQLVQGQVVDPKGAPIPDCRLTFLLSQVAAGTQRMSNLQSGFTTSTEQGNFAIQVPAHQAFDLRISHPGYVPFYKENVTVTPHPLIVHLNDKGGSIKGHVTNMSGQPVSGVVVSLTAVVMGQLSEYFGIPGKGLVPSHMQPGEPATTDKAGAFAFDHLPPSKYYINFNKTNPEMQLAPRLANLLEIKDGETTNVEYRLYSGKSVSGKVVDFQTNQPIEGAVVEIDGSRRRTTSDKDGHYQLSGLFFLGQLKVQKEGFQDARENHFHSFDKIDNHFDIPMAKLLSVSGKILTVDDQPISGADVKLGKPFYLSNIKLDVKTDAEGKYKIWAEPQTKYIVIASARGFAATVLSPLDVVNTPVENVDLKLSPACTIGGQVLEPDDKPATETVVVAYLPVTEGSNYPIELRRAKTDIHGRFILNEVPPNVVLRAIKNGYADSVDYHAALGQGEIRSGVVLNLRKAGTIAGTVKWTKDSRPKIDTVYLNGKDGYFKSTHTDPDGRFRFDGLPENVYSISADDGLTTTAEGVKAGTTDVILEVDNSMITNTRSSGTDSSVDATVLNDLTGKPVDSYTIKSNNIGDEPEHLPGGKFKVSPWPSGGSITIASPGYLDCRKTIYAPRDGGTTTVVFRMETGGTLVGRVVDEQTSKPIAGIMVGDLGLAADPRPMEAVPMAQGRTDPDGKFTISPVPTGDNNLVIKAADGRQPVKVIVKGQNGRQMDAGTIVVGKASVVRGKLVRDGAGGASLAGVPIHYNNNRASGLGDTITTEDGSFEFDSMVPGNYTLSSSVTPVRTTFDILAGEVKVVTIPVGSIRFTGKVTKAGKAVNFIAYANSASSELEYNCESRNLPPGEFEINNMVPGDYVFTIREVKEPGTWSASTPLVETVHVDQRETVEHRFNLRSSEFQIKILDSAGQPVSGAQVHFLLEPRADSRPTYLDPSIFYRNDLTDAEGNWKSGVLPVGEYRILAFKSGVGSAYRDKVQMADSAIPLELTLQQSGGNLESVALKYEDGGPLPGATCTVSNLTSSTHRLYLKIEGNPRDASGVVLVQNLPAGEYGVYVSAPNYAMGFHQVKIKEGETAHVQDVLMPAGTIEWKLRNADGNTTEDYQVRIAPQDPTLGRGTIYSGLSIGMKFTTPLLAAGNYQLTATMNGNPPVTENLTITAGQTTKKETVVHWK